MLSLKMRQCEMEMMVATLIHLTVSFMLIYLQACELRKKVGELLARAVAQVSYLCIIYGRL